MIGYHAVSLVADAWAKGCRSFDVRKAYRAALRAAEYDTTGIRCPDWMIPYVMPRARYWKNAVGYVPCDRDKEAVAKRWSMPTTTGVSPCWPANWATRPMPAGMRPLRRVTALITIRPRASCGGWIPAASGVSLSIRMRRITGTMTIARGMPGSGAGLFPHDPEGLMELMGGRERFVRRLDSLFTADPRLEGDQVSADISGLIGQYAHGNEPSHHITHLYNYAGVPWRTQELVDQVLRTLYSDAPDGLSGNEDCGQMSAWYVMNAMGFYQVCPGRPVYSIGRPLFEEVTLRLEGGKTFVIRAKNNSEKTSISVRRR